MIQDIDNKTFNNDYKDIQPEENDYICMYTGNKKREQKIFLRKVKETFYIPKYNELIENKILSGKENFIYLFEISGDKYFLALDAIEADFEKDGYAFNNPRALRRPVMNEFHQSFAGMTAYHLYQWYNDNRICGRCGETLVHDTKERMMKCPKCSNMVFPKIAPAVIIGVKNGESILMSRYAGREYKGRALIAGFIEIGETPEDTVKREVMEEVGLKVKNITYYKSQPWGFDMNLLLGYYCELDGDAHIDIDEEELATAGFVKRSDIEYDPLLMSLTSNMIEDFRNGTVK